MNYKMINSPLCWLGGKSQSRKKIIAMFPPHICYCEPLCGAAWVLFGKPRSKSECINDINNDLINFFNVVQEKKRELIDSLRWEICSRVQFSRYLHDLQTPDIRKTLSDVQIAHRFYYVLKASFGGQSQYFGYAKTQRAKLNVSEFEKAIEPVHKRLCGVHIENRPYEKVMDSFDSEKTFFFVDPPYRGRSSRKYAQYMNDNDYVILRDRLIDIKGKFLLSLNSDQYIYDLFAPYFRIETMKTNYSVNSKTNKKVEEILIMNYDPPVLN